MQYSLKLKKGGNRKDYRRITDSELIADLQSVAKRLNKSTITHNEYNSLGKYDSHIFGRRFGGWLNSLEMANLEKTRNYNVSDEDAFQNLEEVWIKLGKQPRREDLLRPLSKYSGAFYEYRFGTWNNALTKFVAHINREESTVSSELGKIKYDPHKQHETNRNINLQLRFTIFKRDNFKCKNCGRSPATDPSIILHVDHIKAWANGGETKLENLQTLCSVCNIGKSDLE